MIQLAKKILSRPFAGTILIGLTVILFYSGSLKNDTALDDILVLTSNSYVQDGLKGIPDIFSHDYFYGATRNPATRLGWRYRPLSLVFFAVIHEFAGDNWPTYHFFSMLLYFLCGWLMYRFLLRWFLKDNPAAALIAALAFIILPVHVEVVANIKSMDELLACLFSVAFMDRLLTWNTDKRILSLFLTCLYFTAAIFSKESSIILAFLAPVLIFVQSGKSVLSCLRQTIPFWLLSAGFIAVRLSISQLPAEPLNITNDPYFAASIEQKLATISIVLAKYLRLIFFPEFLSFDYGYRYIPFVNFSYPASWVSAGGHLVSLVGSIWLILKRKPAGFFLAAYLGGMLLISNLFFDAGPIMADRFAFTPSLFLIAGLILLMESFFSAQKKNRSTAIASGILIALIIPAFVLTTQRVREWKDNLTLYRADLQKVPESYRVQAFNGMEEINQATTLSDTDERNAKYLQGIGLMWKAYQIYPDYKNMYDQWGMAYLNLGKIDSAAWAWGRLRELWPTKNNIEVYGTLIQNAKTNQKNAQLNANYDLFNKQMQAYNENFMKGDYKKLSEILNLALKYKPDEAPIWALLGRVYYLHGKTDSARFALKEATRLDPENKEALEILKLLK